MRDTYRRYRARKQALRQFFPSLGSRPRARHCTTLVALIGGRAGGQSAHRSTIPDPAPSGGATHASLILRFRRWLKHAAQTLDGWFLPVAQALLVNRAPQPLRLAIDGRVVGRGCIALMGSVISHGRALPLAWVVVKGKQGPFPQALPGALLKQLQPLVPHTAEVVVLGDGEVDGTGVQALLRAFGWQSGCRTAPKLLMTVDGRARPIGALAPVRGELLAVRPAWMTAEQDGPVSMLASWEAAYEAPR
jgi:hypothetical protein